MREFLLGVRHVLYVIGLILCVMLALGIFLTMAAGVVLYLVVMTIVYLGVAPVYAFMSIAILVTIIASLKKLMRKPK